LNKINSILNRPFLAFFLSFFLIGGVFFLLPINLFSGKIVENSTGVSKTISAPLSLSYFLGFGYDEKDMENVQDFYLTSEGYALAICLLFGIPFLVALRIHYRNKLI